MEFNIGKIFTATQVFSICKKLHEEREDLEDGSNLYKRIVKYDSYKIGYIPIKLLTLDEVYIDEDSVEEYLDMPEETMPPIAITKKLRGKIWINDGHHRTLAQKKRGSDKILAFIPV